MTAPKQVSRAALLLMMIISGCDFISTVGNENMLRSNDQHVVVERLELFSERTYYYAPAGSFGDKENYTFLFGACPSDCSEVLEQVGFSPDGQHFAVRTSSSDKKKRARVLLYSFRGQTVRPLLELTDAAITSYAFTDSTLVYSLGSVTRSVALE